MGRDHSFHTHTLSVGGKTFSVTRPGTGCAINSTATNSKFPYAVSPIQREAPILYPSKAVPAPVGATTLNMMPGKRVPAPAA